MLNILSKIAIRLGVFLVAGYLSPAILFLANLIPLIGVAFFDWNANDIILIYVYETAIVLFFALLKIIYVQIIGKNDAYFDYLTTEQLRHSTVSIFLSDIFASIKNPFISIILCLLIFSGLLYSILFFSLLILDKDFILQEPIAYTIAGSTQQFWIALVVIAIEHFILFINNFLIWKEYNYFHPFAIPLKRIFFILFVMIIVIEVDEVFASHSFIFLAALIFLKMLGEMNMLIGERRNISKEK